ncbi:META domain-containing protein [Labedella endophytica]|jgi:heat shock protein HslJ|uniref:META domain-containing protein n=1 Tax=Labedella endophytica TaxID=1523160 RepID=A0A3S0XKT0_9MICO|nr:META domain-containing protein [Labedella endophytica]RUQ98284.1 META domain-containing protein [Labedella endophytica]
MSGLSTSTFRRNGRLITAFLIGIASVSVLTACAAGSTAGGEPDPAEAIVGTWGSTAQGQPHLVFGDDGKVSGTDGCNGVGSTYTVDGDTITLATFMSTQRACIGVDTWLRAVSTVQLDGDAIIVRNASGDEIGSLDRNDG